jgi:diguanylate cyclase (GGDEF)-like protein
MAEISKSAKQANDVLLQIALASMPYGFSVWDEQLRLIAFNENYLTMYHLPADRVQVGTSLHQMAALTSTIGDHGTLSVEQIYALYRARFLEEGSGINEHLVGSRVIRSTSTRMPGLGWLSTHQDITDQVELTRLAAAREAALERQNMRFAAAVSNMPQGLSMFGPDRRLVICNDQFAQMYGLPPELVVQGTPFADILDYRVANGLIPDGEERDTYVPSRMQYVAEHFRTVRFVERERGRVISVIQQPIADGGWVSTHQDITDQRQKEELIQARKRELEVQNIRFNAAINNMLHGLSMFDAENRLIVCNRQYAEMYGLPPELTRPGTSFWAMCEAGEATGMVSIAERETRVKVLGAVIEAGRPFKNNVKMANGRVIAVLHQPMQGGGWISTHEDVTEQHQHEEMIRHLARHDALTDLPNRVQFGEEMAKIEARIKRQEIVAVLCIDLDHFKQVNDTLGHGVGDGVLTVVAKRLREAARETDLVARLGGDEFAVLVGPLDEPEHAVIIADRIVRSIAQPMLVDENQIVIGASIGISVAPLDGIDAETLLKNADLALYRAKSEGRGTYHFFEQGMDDALKLRRALETGLKSALARGELRLAFQPLVNLADNRISSVEALLRWDHPERGPIAPAEFIPVAEDTGLIVPIGEWVLRAACRAAAGWPAPIRVAVNVSAVQFRHKGLLQAVEGALANAGLAADRLELDVTEAVLLADPEGAPRALHQLKAMGVRIVMDDFGTGQSSLRCLRSFPFDKVKIDRSLIGVLGQDRDATVMVDTLIGFALGLGMATTSEGVETVEQLDLVRQRGSTEAQGFLFSPPLPASGIDAWLGAVRANEARRLAG